MSVESEVMIAALEKANQVDLAVGENTDIELQNLETKETLRFSVEKTEDSLEVSQYPN